MRTTILSLFGFILYRLTCSFVTLLWLLFPLCTSIYILSENTLLLRFFNFSSILLSLIFPDSYFIFLSFTTLLNTIMALIYTPTIPYWLTWTLLSLLLYLLLLFFDSFLLFKNYFLLMLWLFSCISILYTIDTYYQSLLLSLDLLLINIFFDVLNV